MNTGLPVPDLVELMNGNLVAHQQEMPGLGNTPKPFARFDRDLPFFWNFPFGTVVQDTNWFAADGIPIVPVDDQGRSNAYPLVKVEARDSQGNVLAATDVVLPVASEADCHRITSYNVCYTKLLRAVGEAELVGAPRPQQRHAVAPGEAAVPVVGAGITPVGEADGVVITSYSIHYTKLYEIAPSPTCAAVSAGTSRDWWASPTSCRRWSGCPASHGTCRCRRW